MWKKFKLWYFDTIGFHCDCCHKNFLGKGNFGMFWSEKSFIKSRKERKIQRALGTQENVCGKCIATKYMEIITISSGNMKNKVK